MADRWEIPEEVMEKLKRLGLTDSQMSVVRAIADLGYRAGAASAMQMFQALYREPKGKVQ